ncbi:omega-conotoxin-like protein 1 [Linepithema humile]|uniref:omega-conotoxin-like protein 1 n=1 Tax=Linepithema humile TaxID=83485 RepID=UPI00351F0239
MGKLLVLLCFALLAMTLIMACTPPGQICTSSSDCCPGFQCNPWAGRCTSPKRVGTGGQ